MTATTQDTLRFDPELKHSARPALNRDRGEIRMHHSDGHDLLHYLSRHGIHGTLNQDDIGGLICLDDETDMSRVAALISEWSHLVGVE